MEQTQDIELYELLTNYAQESNCSVLNITPTDITFQCNRCKNVVTLTHQMFITACIKDGSPCTNCSLQSILQKYKHGEYDNRLLLIRISNLESLSKQVRDATSFLDEYNPTISERFYYLIHDLKEVQRCKFCGKKLKWNTRNELSKGYWLTCGDKACDAKRRAIKMTGSSSISESRDKKFVEWQATVIEINDDIVKKYIKYDKFVNMLTNPIIINYLKNRYDDSSSLLETVQRIRFGIEKKPICAREGCNKPVVWVGKKSLMMRTHCCQSCAGLDEKTQEKRFDTCEKVWGTRGVYDSEKHQQMYKEKYGVAASAQRKDVIEHRNETFLKNYGTIHPTQCQSVKDKTANTFMERYGVKTTFMLPEIRELAVKKLNENSKYATSDREKQVREIISRFYNIDNEKMDKSRFNYNVDFYLPDYDLYIEYQGSQFHHERAFLGTAEDEAELESLIDKAKERESETGQKSQASTIAYVWAELDVKKREEARDKNLNYLEIYSFHDEEDIIRQIQLFIHCLQGTCPIVFDDEGLDNEFSYYKSMHVKKLSDVTMLNQRNSIVKSFQFCEFYKKEMDFYARDPVLRRKLIQNRIHYLGKKEYELTVKDLMDGFKKSGLHYGYSHFNPQWTNWFVNKFKVKSVYDVCGGWGHHLLGMLSCDRIVYNDFNKSVCENVEKMKNRFGIDSLEVMNCDARDLKIDDVDAWFMCPPYYNVESYDGKSFKDIDDYKKFLNKIFRNWLESDCKLFGLVIREDLVGLVDCCEWSECHLLKVSKSHFNRTSGERRSNEKFYIFKK